MFSSSIEVRGGGKQCLSINNLFKEAVLTLIGGERQIGVLSTWSCGLLSCSRGWVGVMRKEKTRRKTTKDVERRRKTSKDGEADTRKDRI